MSENKCYENKCYENISKFTWEHTCRSVVSIKLLCNFVEITLRHGCFPVNLQRIFRTPFTKNTSGRLLLYVKICIFWKCLQYTIHWDKTKKISFEQNKRYENALFFFRELQLTTVLLLISDSYMSKVCLSETGSGIFHVRFCFFFIKVYIFVKKMHRLFDFKTS